MQPSRVWRSTNGSIMPLSSACARIHLSDITAMDLFLTFDVEHADEGEKPACGVEVNLHLRRKPFLQYLCRIVVDSPSLHVARFYLHRRGVAHRSLLAVADREILPDHAPERGKRNADLSEDRKGRRRNFS